MRFRSVIACDVLSPYKAAEMCTNTQADINGWVSSAHEVDVSDAVVTGYRLWKCEGPTET